MENTSTALEQVNNYINIAWIVLFASLFILACNLIYLRWLDKNYARTKEICEDCEFDNDKFCKHCGTHEYEKQLIK